MKRQRRHPQVLVLLCRTLILTKLRGIVKFKTDFIRCTWLEKTIHTQPIKGFLLNIGVKIVFACTKCLCSTITYIQILFYPNSILYGNIRLSKSNESSKNYHTYMIIENTCRSRTAHRPEDSWSPLAYDSSSYSIPLYMQFSKLCQL